MSTGGPSLPGRFLGVARRWETYSRLLYVLVSLPIGIAVFVGLATLLAVGGGLAVTVLGIPILVATMYGWCVVADFERVLSNLMLRTGIRPLPFAKEGARPWMWPRLRSRLTNAHTWRSLAFVTLRLPVATTAFVIVAATVGTAVNLLISPATYWIGEGSDVLGWRINTVAEALAAVVAGAVLILPSLHVANLTGRAMGKLNEVLLQSPPEGEEITGKVERAAMATLLWPGLVEARHHDALARARTMHFRVWAGHVALYVATMVVLLFLNGATTPDRWWSLWPAWGWGIAVALHTGYFLGGHLAGHAATYLVATLGFFVIDSLYTDRSWFYWPMMGWGTAVAAHAYAVYGFSRINATPALVEHAPDGGDDGWRLAPPAGIVVDEPMRVVQVDGKPIEVTPREFELLVLLTGNPGRPFSREELLDRIWKDDYEVTDRTIDTHVQRLRKKLGPRAEAIQTVWGIGYRYQP